MGVGGWDLERKECGLGDGWAVRTQKPSCLRNQVKAPVTLLVKELTAFVHIAPPHPHTALKEAPFLPGLWDKCLMLDSKNCGRGAYICVCAGREEGYIHLEEPLAWGGGEGSVEGC